MELCLYPDGGENLYLRVPTFWDDAKKEWVGFLKLPNSQKLVYGHGKNSFDLQNSFNNACSAIFEKQDEIAKELFDQFMPAFYWDDK